MTTINDYPNNRSFKELLFKFCRLCFAILMVCIVIWGLTNCKKTTVTPVQNDPNKVTVVFKTMSKCSPTTSLEPAPYCVLFLYTSQENLDNGVIYKVLETGGDARTDVTPIPIGGYYFAARGSGQGCTTRQFRKYMGKVSITKNLIDYVIPVNG
jgi:hypothetical protein